MNLEQQRLRRMRNKTRTNRAIIDDLYITLHIFQTIYLYHCKPISPILQLMKHQYHPIFTPRPLHKVATLPHLSIGYPSRLTRPQHDVSTCNQTCQHNSHPCPKTSLIDISINFPPHPFTSPPYISITPIAIMDKVHTIMDCKFFHPHLHHNH